MDLPAPPVPGQQIPLPLFFIADIPQSRQVTGVNQVITVSQEPDNRTAPDFLHGVLLKGGPVEEPQEGKVAARD
ncbi:hypothetical protein LU604_25480 [Erwinia tracheiphila]|uniref:hypothetical protein n=1 Tax=Erwinia tracheiphila TaxID=65700 RepID=UPI001F1CC1E8|nr:hypothetical protein [Erwinia tracheiphila]UIA83545.1 hypothetical protein LU604_25480 [Erwinia tracheiphila]